MKPVIKFALFCVAGAASGLFSTQYLIDGKAGGFALHKGPWTTWPSAGRPSIDPYTRAHFLTSGKLPVSPLEVIEFEARADDEGNLLDSACDYKLAGPMPKARWWSLASFAEDGDGDGQNSQTGTLTSTEAVYQPRGRLIISASREPRTGNWLVPPGTGRYVLVFRMYNPDKSLRDRPLKAGLLAIKRETCR